MVRQYSNGYFINGKWVDGNYSTEQITYIYVPIDSHTKTLMDHTQYNYTEPIDTPYIQYLLLIILLIVCAIVVSLMFF